MAVLTSTINQTPGHDGQLTISTVKFVPESTYIWQTCPTPAKAAEIHSLGFIAINAEKKSSYPPTDHSGNSLATSWWP